MFIRKKRNEHQCSYVRSIVSESDSNDLLMSKVSVVFFDGFDISHHIRVIIIFIFSGKPRNVSYKNAQCDVHFAGLFVLFCIENPTHVQLVHAQWLFL